MKQEFGTTNSKFKIKVNKIFQIVIQYKKLNETIQAYLDKILSRKKHISSILDCSVYRL